MQIDGLDAPSLRDPSAQEALAMVCSASTNVQLVATVDHYNASVLWPAPRFARYAFAYFDATTYECYAQHLLTGESRLLGTYRVRLVNSTAAPQYRHCICQWRRSAHAAVARECLDIVDDERATYIDQASAVRRRADGHRGRQDRDILAAVPCVSVSVRRGDGV